MLPQEYLKSASLIIFCVSFASFLAFEARRHWLAFASAVAVVALGLYTPLEALKSVDWRIIIVFFTTLAAAEVFMLSGAAAVAAEAILARCKAPVWAILVLCALTGFLSLFVENVACVLIAAPISISLARRLNMPPQPILVACALASNLQGCGLLIGDPPSMLLAQGAGLTFFDFIVYAGKPSIFWAVQAGALAGLAYLWFVFRNHKGEVRFERTARLLGWMPSVFLVLLIMSLAIDTQVEGGIGWGAAAGCSFFAILSVIWLWVRTKRLKPHKESIDEALFHHDLPATWSYIKNLDWKTVLFVASVFVPVAALAHYGWVTMLAEAILRVAAGNPLIVFVILVLASMIASAFVDNIPFLLVMLPAVKQMGMGLPGMEGEVPVFLYFGLLLGASVGGNITPIGAQANIAAVGLLRKHGAPVTLKSYIGLALPYSLIAIAASCAVTYLVYGPK